MVGSRCQLKKKEDTDIGEGEMERGQGRWLKGGENRGEEKEKRGINEMMLEIEKYLIIRATCY